MDDFLSELPLGIIHTILERVPIKDAVKTSVLSKQWRYKWATLPNLFFDGECGWDDTLMMNFISHALLLHKGPIHKFHLDYPYLRHCHFLDRWLAFLSRNDIKELIIDVAGNPSNFCINSSLYSCQNLTHLKIKGSTILSPPSTFKKFSSLRSLSLHHVLVAPISTLESIVANSPLLEVLTLESSTSRDLRICAPNLKVLYLQRHNPDLFLNAPLLAELTVINCFKFSARWQHKKSVCNYTDFFGGITKLEELDVDEFFLQLLSIGIESCQGSLVFHRLRAIKLRDVCFHDVKVMSVVFRLVKSAPNLQKLEISSNHARKKASGVGSVSFWDSLDFTFERLKVIKMKGIRGELDEMRFIEFLLASSPVLEKMICESRRDQGSLKLATELLRFRRVSTKAMIWFQENTKAFFSCVCSF